jgi:DNA polymerase elongation subunit (family B)
MERVVKADVESLYPSLMLTHSIAPERDTLGVFLPALNGLTERRVQAKKLAAMEADPAKAQYLDGLQSSFKVLINSFYGYLAGPFPWNDSDAAGRVTSLGRDTVLAIADKLTDDGSEVIEVDTDGVYFVPPPTVIGEAAERAYVQKIGEILPKGVRLAFDGRYLRMLSIKTKNYVLETYDGKRLLKGASLRSRSDEMFGRRFLESAVGFLLKGHPEKASELYREIAESISAGNVGVQDISRRERVTSKTFTSGQRRKLADAAVGVSIGEHVHVYSRSDGTLGVITEGETPDFKPDTRLYLDKLYRFAGRLEAAIGPGFSSLFPSPAELLKEAAGQGVLDLF